MRPVSFATKSFQFNPNPLSFLFAKNLKKKNKTNEGEIVTKTF
jgi:hypothetical protein